MAEKKKAVTAKFNGKSFETLTKKQAKSVRGGTIKAPLAGNAGNAGKPTDK